MHCHFFFFWHFKNVLLLPSLLHGFWWEICSISNCSFSVGNTFSPPVLNFFPLFLIFRHLIMMYLGVDLFEFILYLSLFLFWVYSGIWILEFILLFEFILILSLFRYLNWQVYVFCQIWEVFSHYFFKYFLCAVLSLLLLGLQWQECFRSSVTLP